MATSAFTTVKSERYWSPSPNCKVCGRLSVRGSYLCGTCRPLLFRIDTRKDAAGRRWRIDKPARLEAMRGHTVRPWLAEVTNDRYGEVVVDPESLDVRVRGQGGQWRKASLLSHGTAEQVYLLLRAGLAEHLTKKGETCPLILDDPTAQWDPQRTEASLRVLHAISRERQVLVFSQESDVLAWAQGNLNEPQDHIECLEVVAPV